MSGTQSDIQWYIARDGQQHGPLSEPEMRLFVERGYLRAQDLVWRQGFPDWHPAFSVFAPPAPPAGPGAGSSPASPFGASAGQNSQPSSAAQAAIPAQAQDMRLSPSSLSEAFPNASGEQDIHAGRGHAAHQRDDGFYDSDEEAAPRRGGKIAAALLVLALVCGGGAYYMKDELAQYTGASQQGGAVPVVKAPESETKRPAQSGDQTAAQTAALAPTPAAEPRAVSVASGDIDSRLQRAELWQFAKQNHSAWYDGLLQEAAKIPAGDDFDENLSALLVKQFIAFRRQNADQALASSTGSLITMANAFLGNLQDLAQRDIKACYTFISKGESSQAIIEIMKKPDEPTAIHGQMLAVFKAAAEGKEAPTTHPAPEKKDYEALTQQLMKIGWTKEDIQLFASPAALARAEPAKVCQMVQDWFTAHLGLEDEGAKERLLYETLRPVVSG